MNKYFKTLILFSMLFVFSACTFKYVDQDGKAHIVGIGAFYTEIPHECNASQYGAYRVDTTALGVLASHHALQSSAGVGYTHTSIMSLKEDVCVRIPNN